MSAIIWNHYVGCCQWRSCDWKSVASVHWQRLEPNVRSVETMGSREPSIGAVVVVCLRFVHIYNALL